MTQSKSSPPVPSIPGFAIEKEIGRGGMAVVYRAMQIDPPRPVALKVLRPQAGPAVLARFKAEADALTRLRHPNVVEVFGFGEHASRPYLVMEFCDGSNLDNRLLGQPLPPTAAAELTLTLARTVQFCHDLGIIHRDLKPSNILLSLVDDPTAVEGQGTRDKGQGTIPKIADFGLAKLLDTDANLTRSGAILGSIGFMAPEQATGGAKHAGPGVDIWALGCILYQLLTGDPPIRGPADAGTLIQIIEEEPTPRDGPAPLVAICLHCLRKKPEDRYATAGDLADDLGRFLRGESVEAEKESPTPPMAGKWDWLTPWRKHSAE